MTTHAGTLITVSRAAKLLDTCESTVRAKARRGELPFTRTESGIYLFDRRTIERIAADLLARRDALAAMR